MMHPLLDTCIHLWQDEVAPAYESGHVISKTHLMALTYRYLSTFLTSSLQIKVAPPWQFVRQPGAIVDRLEAFSAQSWLEKQTPITFFIHDEEEVLGAIELQYEPHTYVDYRKSIRKLIHLSQLGGKAALHLLIDPHSGRIDRTEGLPLAEQLLCVYGIITHEGALGLSLDKLRQTLAPERFPKQFLHLTGAIREDRIRFGHVIAASL